MNAARQLGLPFPQEPHYQAEAFLRGSANAEALAWLDRPDAWPDGRLAIQGERGVGKTHLLHVFAQSYSGALLSGTKLRLFMPLPDTTRLAIDDADLIEEPRSLLHVLNAAAERRMLVLLTGRSAPAHWGIQLPDLASRLRSVTVISLPPPDEVLQKRLLLTFLAERQLCVPERLQAYLLLHLPRTGGAMRQAVAHLERLALAHGGQVTRAMAAAIAGETAVLTADAPS